MVRHAVSRNAAFSLGYQYRTGEFGFSEPSEEQQAMIGVEYSPALSRTRRLIFRLNAAPSWLKVPPSELSAESEQVGEQTLYRMHGDASVSYPFRPNWRSTFTYHRGVEYLAGLSEPLLSDGARAEVSGLIARPLDVAASIGFATSSSAYQDTQTKLDYYTATVKVRYAFRRSLAVYSEYLYYFFDQSGVRSLAPVLPVVFDQRGLRFGFTWFIEALGR